MSLCCGTSVLFVALQGLLDLAKEYPIIDVRARGLMVAAEFGGKDGGMTPKYGVASEVTKAAMRHDMLLLTAGEQDGLREALLSAKPSHSEQFDGIKAVFRGCLSLLLLLRCARVLLLLQEHVRQCVSCHLSILVRARSQKRWTS